jgi:hypothetical protein
MVENSIKRYEYFQVLIVWVLSTYATQILLLIRVLQLKFNLLITCLITIISLIFIGEIAY